MRYYLDENQSPASARLARADGVDVLSSHEAGMNGRSDEDQLRFAAAQARCLVTRDYGDFDAIADRLRAAGLTHAGILLVPPSLENGDYAGLALALDDFARLYPSGVPPHFTGYLRNPRR